MTAALLGLLLLVPPGEAAEREYAAILELFRTPIAEPEPPPGLRAPAGSERHEAARRAYEAELAAWRDREEARRARLEELCSVFLERHAEGPRVRDALYVRGVTRYRRADWAGARADLEAFLPKADPQGADTAAARRALVACCRVQGDYAAALKHHAGEDPDLLEEAGQVARAVAVARRLGQTDRAERWTWIGRTFPGGVRVAPGTRAVVLEAGRTLPPEARTALQEAFAPEKVAFLSGFGPQQAIYLLDAQGVIRAVDPRPDTWVHRVKRLLADG